VVETVKTYVEGGNNMNSTTHGRRSASKIIGWLMVLGLSLFLVAYGATPDNSLGTSPKTSQPQSPASKVKACDLLTKEEVEGIIGQKIDSVGVQPGYGNCIYYIREKVFGQVMALPIVTVGYSKSDVQSRWDYWSSTSKKEVITGVGDGAIWSPDYDFFVCRVKGGLLMISIKDKDMAIRLAKKAITRIK